MNTPHKNKWLKRALLALVPLGLLNACKEIDTGITIQAPPSEVWQVLSDFKTYSEWNPYHVSVQGQGLEGSQLEVQVHKPNGNSLTLHPQVLSFKSEEELIWGGGIPGLFQGRHVFALSPTSEGHTQLRHSEVFSGLLVPLAELDSIEEGYRAMNEALKTRIEQKRVEQKRE